MDLNQSKVSSNISAIEQMYAQAGVGDPHDADVTSLEDFVTIVHGDLGTYEKVLSALRRRSVEDNEYNRLQGVVFAIGLFHFKMAAADAIWRIYMTNAKSRTDSTSFGRILGKLRPQDSSRLIANAKFRQQHELIYHILTVLQLDCWRIEVHRRTGFASLEEWAASKPALADIEEIADYLSCHYLEGEYEVDLFKMQCQRKEHRDEERRNIMRTHHHLLLYLELCYALNAGDIGRFESLVPPWIQIFRATGKHKYGNYTLRFMHSLYFIYPERLR